MTWWKVCGNRPLFVWVCALALTCALFQLALPAAAFAESVGQDDSWDESGAAQVEADIAQEESGNTSVYVLPHLAGSADGWEQAGADNVTETVSVAPSDGVLLEGAASNWAGTDGASPGKLPATGDSAKAFAFAAASACASACLAAAAARRSRGQAHVSAMVD